MLEEVRAMIVQLSFVLVLSELRTDFFGAKIINKPIDADITITGDKKEEFIITNKNLS